MKPILYIVIPCYNEEKVLPITAPLFLDQLKSMQAKELISSESKIMFINDGSKDNTLPLLKELAQKNPSVKVITLSRNFGKEAALTAGLAEAAKADALIVLDADLQDPPELIASFVEKFKEGYDTVYAARQNRDTDSYFKRATADAFYRVYNALAERPIPTDAGDCRLIFGPSANAADTATAARATTRLFIFDFLSLIRPHAAADKR